MLGTPDSVRGGVVGEDSQEEPPKCPLEELPTVVGVLGVLVIPALVAMQQMGHMNVALRVLSLRGLLLRRTRRGAPVGENVSGLMHPLMRECLVFRLYACYNQPACRITASRLEGLAGARDRRAAARAMEEI